MYRYSITHKSFLLDPAAEPNPAESGTIEENKRRYVLAHLDFGMVDKAQWDFLVHLRGVNRDTSSELSSGDQCKRLPNCTTVISNPTYQRE